VGREGRKSKRYSFAVRVKVLVSQGEGWIQGKSKKRFMRLAGSYDHEQLFERRLAGMRFCGKDLGGTIKEKRARKRAV